jgi:hypothetical protein
MANDKRQTEAETTGEQLPEPPAYDCPYEPGTAGYDMAEQSGYYGVMYAGEYEWDNVRCTAEAYGEYDPNARPGNRRKSIDGKSRRSLKFHSTWMDVETATECVHKVGEYNRFEPEHVAVALEAMPSDVRVVVGRESSPVMYVWTADQKGATAAFNGIGASWDEIAAALTGETNDPTASPPDELGGVPNAETYPIRTVGEAPEDLETGVPILIRAWWD